MTAAAVFDAATVPRDDRAEEVIAAVATISHIGALAATDRLTSDDFFDPRAAAVFGVSLNPELPGQLDARIAAIAEAADVWPLWLAEVVRRCPVQWDITGSFADRVADAARRRRRFFELLADFEEVTCG